MIGSSLVLSDTYLSVAIVHVHKTESIVFYTPMNNKQTQENNFETARFTRVPSGALFLLFVDLIVAS